MTEESPLSIWVLFHDMHSGGGQKLDWGHIFIEAFSETEAREYFASRFHRDPDHVTCSCCGEDYSVSCSPSLREATAFERNCAFGKDGNYIEEPRSGYSNHRTVEEYAKDPNVLIVSLKNRGSDDLLKPKADGTFEPTR